MWSEWTFLACAERCQPGAPSKRARRQRCAHLRLGEVEGEGLPPVHDGGRLADLPADLLEEGELAEAAAEAMGEGANVPGGRVLGRVVEDDAVDALPHVLAHLQLDLDGGVGV